MTLRFKKRRPLTRSERQFRDTRLFIIATEDTYAPKSYFQLFSNRRIQLKILPTKDGRSSPQDVSDRVNDIRNQFDLYEDDEFWLLLDTDHWIAPNHIATLQRVCQEATQKGYRLAVSNPCFELWLLLHILPAENISQCGCCADVVAQLKVSLGGYNKKKPLDRLRFTPETIRIAVTRAEALDTESTADRWPQTTGTHVYRLVRKLL